MPTPNLSLSGKPRNQKLADARRYVNDLLEAMVSGKEDRLFAQYLDCAARFWRYSSRNILLIMVQDPRAIRVAGRGTWAGLNRHIVRGARALWLWAPNFHTEHVIDQETGDLKDITHRHFTLVPVFDVAQTSVIPGRQDLYVPTFHPDLGEVAPLIDAAIAWATSVGYRLEFRPLFRQIGLGFAAPGGKIVVDDSTRLGEQLQTLIHEICHQVLGHVSTKTERRLAEAEAESTAYLVLRHFGYAPTSTSAAYLLNHQITPALVSAILQRTTSAARTIIEGTEANLASPHEEAAHQVHPQGTAS